MYIRAVNIKGESVRSGVIYQYAGAVPTGLAAPVLDVSSRTDTTVSVSWSIPTTSTTTILGYQILINQPNSNSIPSIIAYDGSGISTVKIATIRGLVSQSGYYIAMRVQNRAGWSNLSPYLELTAGRLPSPPPRAPALIKSYANHIQFSWVPTTEIGGASKIDGYKIYANGDYVASVSP